MKHTTSAGGVDVAHTGASPASTPPADVAVTAPAPWHERSRMEFDLREAPGSSRVLMRRFADDEGKNFDGTPATWQDIATFSSYNDAESVLGLLRKGLARG